MLIHIQASLRDVVKLLLGTGAFTDGTGVLPGAREEVSFVIEASVEETVASEILKLLLDAGADVNFTNEESATVIR